MWLIIFVKPAGSVVCTCSINHSCLLQSAHVNLYVKYSNFPTSAQSFALLKMSNSDDRHVPASDWHVFSKAWHVFSKACHYTILTRGWHFNILLVARIVVVLILFICIQKGEDLFLFEYVAMPCRARLEESHAE